MRTARILEHREIALKIASSLLRRWGAHMEQDEVQSLADLALCEAERRFDEGRDAKFSTFLFYFVQNSLTREIRFRKRSPQLHAPVVIKGSEQKHIHVRAGTPRAEEACSVSADESPESVVYHRQLRALLRSALANLNTLEKRVLIEVAVHDESIAQVARTIGYSREYLSTVRSAACRKLRPLFSEELREAA